MITAPDWWTGDVSRETLEKLQAYEDLIRKWTRKINLVARSTLNDIEQRHIWDAAQVFAERSGRWADLGSGGGLPGVVAAIFAQAQGLDTHFVLVESDQRKATFLRTCARELGVPFTVVAERIEDVPPLSAQTVSARALASLDVLLMLAEPHLAEDGLCIFQKGAQWQREVAEAEKNWRFSYEAMQSKTNEEAVVLKIKDIQRV
ncbi:16S rRNA (guanine(527)-N(7))-methyltransferase RsmG [Tateyamaria omphalii]|uniref:16S rRNA (guanine(527)-N(7))-methyltransferase RsmG n=1 Tax=Tateyamaria omphalii TaxID=299262 RepID=UPI001C9992AA|nr:16S rRNA (guanine(527)-N(7))-methyltransferase RsmG [Tateyamaria omphalii]MBY5933398.1 16S rRNA (guanine(527)-N(7))-methyltransferase RsmG [Tateyamaria omphalii]